MTRTTKIFALCILLLLAVTASAQDNKSIVAHANGDGTLKLGDEKFKVSTVVIKLFEDGKAEINLVSEITVFVSGTWSWKDDSKQVINLKIEQVRKRGLPPLFELTLGLEIQRQIAMGGFARAVQ